jgi:hypothetical protein
MMVITLLWDNSTAEIGKIFAEMIRQQVQIISGANLERRYHEFGCSFTLRKSGCQTIMIWLEQE